MCVRVHVCVLVHVHVCVPVHVHVCVCVCTHVQCHSSAGETSWPLGLTCVSLFWIMRNIYRESQYICDNYRITMESATQHC